MTSLRIASVGYLNARPLVRGFLQESHANRYSLSETSPAQCAERLRAEEAEVALIPSIEFQRIPGLSILPGIGIATKGRARSVLLLSRLAAPEIRTVAVDSSSRTSAALLRLLLDRRARNRVEYHEVPPRFPAMLEDCDAALIIGDPALKAPTQGLRVYDLAEEWFAMTGLPFVFAFWAVRPGVRLPEGAAPFLASRKLGLESIDRIASEEAPKLELPEAFLAQYLRENIRYELGAEEIRSLWLFYRLAREAGIVPSVREIAFVEPNSGREELAQTGGAS